MDRYREHSTSITIRQRTRAMLEDLRDNYNSDPLVTWDVFFAELVDFVKEKLGEEE